MRGRLNSARRVGKDAVFVGRTQRKVPRTPLRCLPRKAIGPSLVFFAASGSTGDESATQRLGVKRTELGQFGFT